MKNMGSVPNFTNFNIGTEGLQEFTSCQLACTVEEKQKRNQSSAEQIQSSTSHRAAHQNQPQSRHIIPPCRATGGGCGSGGGVENPASRRAI